MKIDKFTEFDKQSSILGKNTWSVARLITLSKDLPVMEIPLDHLNICYTYGDQSLRELVEHFKSVNDADLNYPIILDEDGEIMDGRHRVMKCLLLGIKTIKAVRFEENPIPCQRDES